MNKPNIKNISGVEVHLEGYKIPYISINITEQENSIPSAQIVMPGSTGALKILPGTIVQIFADIYNKRFRRKVSTLLFEGEVTGITYSRSSTGEIVQVNAASLFQRMFTAKLKPADTMVTVQNSALYGIITEKTVVMNSQTTTNNNAIITPANINNLRTYIEDIQENNYVSDDRKEVGAVTSMGGMLDEIAVALNHGAAKDGDLWPLFRDFHKYFEVADLYYGLLSGSFRIGPSILVMPNPDNMFAFRNELGILALMQMSADIQNMSTNSQEYLTLWDVFKNILVHLNYRMVLPASFTAVQNFFMSKPESAFTPARAFMVPDFQGAPPARCNVFYPEEVQSISFQRNFAGEPTRLIMRAQLPFPDPTNVNKGSKYVYVAPDIPIYTRLSASGKKEIALTFTDEETYRGIQAREGIVSSTLARTAYSHYLQVNTDTGQKVHQEPTEADLETTLAATLRIFCVTEFINQRFATRVANISGDWNPYRMVGLPGMVFGKNKPTLVGVVSSVSTNISAQGVATSATVLRNCRYIYDEDPEYIKVIQQQLDEDVAPRKTNSLSDYMVHPLTSEGILAANEWLFNKDFYGFEEIGTDIYTYMIEGIASPRGGFEALAGSDLVLPNTSTKIWKNHKSKLGKTYFQKSTQRDNSILTYVKDSPNELKKGIKTSVLKTFPVEIQYSAILFKAIRALKDSYYQRKRVSSNSDSRQNPIYEFIQRETYRNLITKSEYLAYIGATNNQIDHYVDCYDLQGMFASGYTPSKLKEDIAIKGTAQIRGEDNNSTTKVAGLRLSLSKLIEIRNKLDFVDKKMGASPQNWVTKNTQEIEKVILGQAQTLATELQNTLNIDCFQRAQQYLNNIAIGEKSVVFRETEPSQIVSSTFYQNVENQKVDLFKAIKECLKAAKEAVNAKISELNDELKKANQPQIENETIETKRSNMKDVTKSLFKPYNITRRAHVVSSLRTFKNAKKETSTQPLTIIKDR